MQKSRLGESKFMEKIGLEGNFGAVLTLSWLVRLKIGVKMSKLTPLGGPRGTKLALKGALGAPKEAPRAPKRAWLTLTKLQDSCKTAATGLNDGGGLPKVSK